jgi:hypothetical protein
MADLCRRDIVRREAAEDLVQVEGLLGRGQTDTSCFLGPLVGGFPVSGTSLKAE